jgi:hypothetical protein
LSFIHIRFPSTEVRQRFDPGTAVTEGKNGRIFAFYNNSCSARVSHKAVMFIFFDVSVSIPLAAMPSSRHCRQCPLAPPEETFRRKASVSGDGHCFLYSNSVTEIDFVI